MIRHVVLLRFVEEAHESAIEQYAHAVAELPALIPEIVTFTSGRDVGKAFGPAAATNWDFVVSATFADLEAYRRYAEHPDHRALVERHLAGLMSDRAALQIEESTAPRSWNVG